MKLKAVLGALLALCTGVVAQNHIVKNPITTNWPVQMTNIILSISGGGAATNLWYPTGTAPVVVTSNTPTSFTFSAPSVVTTNETRNVTFGGGVNMGGANVTNADTVQATTFSGSGASLTSLSGSNVTYALFGSRYAKFGTHNADGSDSFPIFQAASQGTTNAGVLVYTDTLLGRVAMFNACYAGGVEVAGTHNEFFWDGHGYVGKTDASDGVQWDALGNLTVDGNIAITPSLTTGAFYGIGSGLSNIPVAGLSATGIGDAKYLKGDGTWDTPGGTGDMTKAAYDTNANDVVDVAATAQTVTYADFGANYASIGQTTPGAGTSAAIFSSTNLTFLAAGFTASETALVWYLGGAGETTFNADGTASLCSGNITWDASGNITAPSFSGDGSALTGIESNCLSATLWTAISNAATGGTGTGSSNLLDTAYTVTVTNAAAGSNANLTVSGNATAAAVVADVWYPGLTNAPFLGTDVNGKLETGTNANLLALAAGNPVPSADNLTADVGGYVSISDSGFYWTNDVLHFGADTLIAAGFTGNLTGNVTGNADTATSATNLYGQHFPPVSIKHTNYTATATDAVLLCVVTNTGFTITFPAATTAGKMFTVIATNATYGVTVTNVGGGLVRGALTQVWTNDPRTFIADGVSAYW